MTDHEHSSFPITIECPKCAGPALRTDELEGPGYEVAVYRCAEDACTGAAIRFHGSVEAAQHLLTAADYYGAEVEVRSAHFGPHGPDRIGDAARLLELDADDLRRLFATREELDQAEAEGAGTAQPLGAAGTAPSNERADGPPDGPRSPKAPDSPAERSSGPWPNPDYIGGRITDARWGPPEKAEDPGGPKTGSERGHSASDFRAEREATFTPRRCAGFPEAGSCDNAAGSTHSPDFCQACDDLRRAHIDKRFGEIGENLRKLTMLPKRDPDDEPLL